MPQGACGRRYSHGLEARPAGPLAARPNRPVGRSQGAGHRHSAPSRKRLTPRRPRVASCGKWLASLAELEHSLIQERTKAGRSAAVARGVKMGRKPKLSPQQVTHARKLIGQGEHHDTVAQSLSVSRRTIYRALQEAGVAAVHETK